MTTAKPTGAQKPELLFDLNKLFHTKIRAVGYSPTFFATIVRTVFTDCILAHNHPFIRAVEGNQFV